MTTEPRIDRAGAVVLWFLLMQLISIFADYVGDWLKGAAIGTGIAGAITTGAWNCPGLGLVLAAPLGCCCLFAFHAPDPWFCYAGVPLTAASAVLGVRAAMLRRLI